MKIPAQNTQEIEHLLKTRAGVVPKTMSPAFEARLDAEVLKKLEMMALHRADERTSFLDTIHDYLLSLSSDIMKKPVLIGIGVGAAAALMVIVATWQVTEDKTENDPARLALREERLVALEESPNALVLPLDESLQAFDAIDASLDSEEQLEQDIARALAEEITTTGQALLEEVPQNSVPEPQVPTPQPTNQTPKQSNTNTQSLDALLKSLDSFEETTNSSFSNFDSIDASEDSLTI